MPVTVTEKWESRETTLGEESSVDLLYTIRGTDDDVAAGAALMAASPVLYGGLIRQGTHIERIAESAWEGSVRYGKLDPPDTGDSSFSFDTGGGTEHVTQALATVGTYAALGQSAPDFKGAIGVTPDSVAGVDITVPVYNFSETHYLDTATVTAAYKAALFALTGTVNNASFKGFAAGEVLFQGASGSLRSQDDWEISFKFAASPNVTGLVVGESPASTKKAGNTSGSATATKSMPSPRHSLNVRSPSMSSRSILSAISPDWESGHDR